MRRLALLVLLVPAIAQAQDAGPLADRVATALRVDLAVEAGNAMADSLEAIADSPAMAGFPGGHFGTMAGAFRLDAAALTDSVRAALAASPHPELLAEAAAYLESPEGRRLQEAMPLLPGSSPFDALTGRPSAGALADSALTARLLRAGMDVMADPTLQLDMMQLMMAALPAAAGAEMAEELDGFEDMLDTPVMAQMQEMQLTFMVPVYRALLAGLSDDALRAGAAYYESEAGRHVTATVARGMLRYQVPLMVEAMGPMFEGAGEAAGTLAGPDGD